MSQAQLARVLGQSQMWVSDRLRGIQPINLDDMERIGDALDVPALELLPRSFRAAQGLNLSLIPTARMGRSGSPRRIVARAASRPVVSTRRDAVRPVSAIPADHRRPQPTRSGERRRAA